MSYINGWPVTTIGPTAYYTRSGEFLGTNVGLYGNLVPFSPEEAEKKLRAKQFQEMNEQFAAVEKMKSSIDKIASSTDYIKVNAGQFFDKAKVHQFEELKLTTDLDSLPRLSNIARMSLSTTLEQTVVTVCSLASRLMTKLLTWRNKQPSDTWVNKGLLGCRIIASEIAQPIIATVALVEGIFYGFFSLVSKGERKDHYKTLLNSSSFTIVWSAAVSAYYNFSFSPIPIHESQMRELFRSKNH